VVDRLRSIPVACSNGTSPSVPLAIRPGPKPPPITPDFLTDSSSRTGETKAAKAWSSESNERASDWTCSSGSDCQIRQALAFVIAGLAAAALRK